MNLRAQDNFILLLISVLFLGDSLDASYNSTCSIDEVPCWDGKCIHKSWKCDGDKDCSHGEDEESCLQRSCASTEFQCGNGRCIQDNLKCNGDDDCLDNSDEADCDQMLKSCPEGQFMCSNHKRCILRAWICDRKADCGDESDETSALCGVKNCTSTEFACASGHQCIPGRWACDGQKDCADSSDENCEKKLPCTSANGLFQCSDDVCINLSLVCDGTEHCPNGVDEGPACDSMCKEYQCNHNCVATPTHAICMCYHGYRLMSDYRRCEDIDECHDFAVPVCSQLCVNLPGSHYCDCLDGYRLAPDKHSCKATSPYPVQLLYSLTSEIRSIDLHTQEVVSLVNEQKEIIDMAYDQKIRTLFWTDAEERAVKAMDPHDGSIHSVITQGLSRPYGLAVDWLIGLLYIVDAEAGRIVACSMQGLHCSLLQDHLDQPRSVVVDPTRGQMYWSTVGGIPYIAKGSMDGSSWFQLVSTDLKKPQSLFLDNTKDRLYWVDSGLDGIFSVNYDGSDRKAVLAGEIEHPFSVCVFEDRLIWTDNAVNSITFANKFTGKGVTQLVKSVHQPKSLYLKHENLDFSVQNPCQAGLCSHLCLLNNGSGQGESKLGYSCDCPIGYTLENNECRDNRSSPFLLVGHETEILKVALQYIGSEPERAYSVRGMVNVTVVDYDFSRDYAIYSDVNRKVIGAVNLSSIRPREQVLIDKDLGSVESLAVDWVAGNLYWTDSTKKTIEVSRLNGSSRVTLLEKTDGGKPLAIYLDPQHGQLFHSEVGSPSSINKCNMDCTGCVAIVTDVGQVYGLVVEHTEQKLYWTDKTHGHIAVANLDGSVKKILISDLMSPYSLAILSGEIYWTDSETDVLHKFSLIKGKATRDVLTGFPSMMGLVLINWQKYSMGTNGCSEENGGCSHLCLLMENGRTCRCPAGMILHIDEQTCVGEQAEKLACKDTEFGCDENRCIAEALRCDGTTDCQDGSDEFEADCACFQCEDGRGNPPCISLDWVCDDEDDCMDGSDEKGCVFKCGPTEIKCVTINDCVSMSMVCDGIWDCEDGTDEDEARCVTPADNCTEANHKWRCGSGECIDDGQFCNGEQDCEDGEDENEVTCGTPLTSCGAGFFTCNDGFCIRLDSVCDNEKDCSDGSDEGPQCVTTTSLPAPESCGYNTFRCVSNHCVPRDKVCDGAPDCIDASDEGGHCRSACSPSPCGQTCFSTPGGPLCECHSGYVMLTDGSTCQDVNECSVYPPPCSQTCINTEGSYRCRCSNGYSISFDGRGCKATGPRPYLIFGLTNEIATLSLDGHHYDSVLPVLSGSVLSVDVDMVTHDLYWCDTMGSVNKWTNKTKLTTSPGIAVETPVSVSLDWVTGNVYISDMGKRQILACSSGFTWCKVLQHFQGRKPKDIVLYPAKGLMFWSDASIYAKIERCWMNGEKRIAIITSKLVRPNGLAIDYSMDRLYFVDSYLGRLESCDLKGNHRQSFKFEESYKPFSLDVFEDWVYVSDWHAGAVVKVDKNFAGSSTAIHTGISHPSGVKVFHPLKQPPSENPCKLAGCSHMCLLTPSGGQCACPIGFFFKGKSESDCANCSYCKNGGKCALKKSSLTCLCARGFAGKQCEIRLTIPTRMRTIPAVTQTIPAVTLMIPTVTDGHTSQFVFGLIAQLINGTLNSSRSMEEPAHTPGNHSVAAGVVISLLLAAIVVVAVLVYVWKSGNKDGLTKMVWYHKAGVACHTKPEDQEDLVSEHAEVGFTNPGFQEHPDINCNTSTKAALHRYSSDGSIDSAFISTGNGISQYSGGSTCKLIHPQDV